MAELQKQGYTEKDILNTKMENKKLIDLEFLQKQPIPGPFTNSDQVKHYMDELSEGKEKNHRIYIEVRFQRNTSNALKKDASVFRLKDKGKNLSTQDYAF